MTIQIEEGKFYSRADGVARGPALRLSSNHETLHWRVGQQSYRDDGGYYATGSSVLDLVAEAPTPVIKTTDGPQTAETPEWAKQVEAQTAEPEVRVGQKWRWLGHMESEFFTPGKSYKVLSIYPGNDFTSVYVTDDRGTASNGGKGHSWSFGPDAGSDSFLDHFELDDGTYDIKATIADEAKRIVSGARRSAYGKPEDNFERIARFWQAYFENTGRADVKITAADVSPLMRLMKEARLAESPSHYDSFVDLIGYTLTGAEVNGVTKPA